MNIWHIVVLAAVVAVIGVIMHVWKRRKAQDRLGPDGIRRMREMELAGYIRADDLYSAQEFARKYGLELPTDELLALARIRLSRIREHSVCFFNLSRAIEVYDLAGVTPPQREIQPLIIAGLRQQQEDMLYAVQTAHSISRKFPIFPKDALCAAGRELMTHGYLEGAELLRWIGEKPSADLYRRCGDALMGNHHRRDEARSAYERAVTCELEEQNIATAM